ncbi:hypothetical protein Misp02_43700 [Microtetraspora sp. NBRC 16547]|nr:hypothetical protein Misp02_43700 [Microtetraspora sp. NBRC 16547]
MERLPGMADRHLVDDPEQDQIGLALLGDPVSDHETPPPSAPVRRPPYDLPPTVSVNAASRRMIESSII